MTDPLPTPEALKAQARRLRATMAEQGKPITHSAALEAIARQHGQRDWNSAIAAARGAHAPRWQVGQRVRGRYLDQPFTGHVKSASEGAGGFWRLTLVFDTAVDVVRSVHFSNLRRQVRATVNAQGVTVEKTSDGTPHMALFAA